MTIKRKITITTPSYKTCWTVFIVLALIAFAIRLPGLGERPMHTDESVNAYITGQLLAGQAYHYDPQDRHGPVLYLVAEPIARLLGADTFASLTEIQLRLTPVLVGSVTVLLFGAAVELFGFIPCLVAAMLFAFAPLPLYYNRYFIHETLFVAATLGLILSGHRALKRRSLWPAALAGACAGLMLACKETAPLHFFALAIALGAGWFFSRTGTGTGRPARSVAVPPATVSAPGAPGVSFAKMILTGTTAFIVTVILLFSWFGQHWSGLADLVRAIPSFAARAGGEGHEKPCWYYIVLLGAGWSGAILMALAGTGAVITIWDSSRRHFSHVFLLAYGITITGIYGVIPYKTPWLALNFWLPLALLAGLAIAWAWQRTNRSTVRALIHFCAMLIGLLMAHDSWQRVYFKPADEANPYAYAHTSEDLLRLPVRLAELSEQNHLPDPHIAVVAADAWPLPWYLRKFSQVGYWQPGEDPGRADYYITTADMDDKLAARFKNIQPEFFGVRPEVLLFLWAPRSNEPLP